MQAPLREGRQLATVGDQLNIKSCGEIRDIKGKPISKTSRRLYSFNNGQTDVQTNSVAGPS